MKHEFSKAYKNVIVRPLEELDIEQLREWRNNQTNAHYLRKINKITQQQQLDWYHRYLNNNNEIMFAIEESKKWKTLVGSASLYNINEDSAEFGRFLIGNKEVHGQKIGYHSLKAILYIAFQDMNLSQVVLHCYKNNKAALHIYKKVGFEISSERDISDYGIEYEMKISEEKFCENQ